MTTGEIQSAMTSATALLNQVEAQLKASEKRTEHKSQHTYGKSKKDEFNRMAQQVESHIAVTEKRIADLEAKASDIPTRIELVRTYRLLYAYFWLAKEHTHEYPLRGRAFKTPYAQNVEWRNAPPFNHGSSDSTFKAIMGPVSLEHGIYYMPPGERK